MEDKIEQLRGVTGIALALALSFLFLTLLSLLKPINNWWSIGLFIGFVVSATFFIRKSKSAPLSQKAMLITVIGNGIVWSLVSIFSDVLKF